MKPDRKFASRLQFMQRRISMLSAWIGKWPLVRERRLGRLLEEREFEPLTEAQHAALQKAELPRRGMQGVRETLLLDEMDEGPSEDFHGNNRVRMAEGFLRDAMREQNSTATREDCAFDAGYMFALEVVPAGVINTVDHPNHEVLSAAARCLALDAAAMSSASNFIDQRYAPGRDDRHLEALHAWALLMKNAVEARSKPTGSCVKPVNGNHDEVTLRKPAEIPSVFAQISDPGNAHLFTAEAARKAFEHVKVPGAGKTLSKELDEGLDIEGMASKQRQERLANRLVGGAVLVMAVAFVLAVVAIFFIG